MTQCTKMLESGERCSNRAVPGTAFCEQHRNQRIAFRPVSVAPGLPASPALQPAPQPVAVAEDGIIPDWTAQPSAVGEPPAFPGLCADTRNAAGA